MKKRLYMIIVIAAIFVCSSISAGMLDLALDLGMGVARNLSKLLKTGQTTSYATGDDGNLELGIAKSYTVYTTGQYSGTSNLVVNGKTHALSNNCVRDNRTGLMWARYVPTSDIGPAADGKLFWQQYTLGPKTDISFTAGTKTINSVAGNYSADALCAGRKFTVSGTDSNDGTYTVSTISANNIVTVEALADEIAGDSVTIASVDDLIWNALDQANANALGGYSDWRIPNYFELTSIVNLGNCNPVIDTTVFPSTPTSYHWTASTPPCSTTYAFVVPFGTGYVNGTAKQTSKSYVRFVRG